MSYDVVIRNGTVVDGSGLGSYRADVGIVDDRIAFVGSVTERGAQEIDADGQVVTPGFIDGHTHMDAQVFWDATGSSSCWHGVTTAVMGNCGFTLAPVRSDERELVVRNLERAEDIDPTALAAGIDWSFETFPEYLDAVDRLPKGINFAANVGHSALRTWAMGERAFDQEATDDDLAKMRDQLAASLQAGAIGFSTSRSEHHQTSDDRPVASRLASWDEVVALVDVMAAQGSGIFEGADGGMSSPDPDIRSQALGRMQTLAADSHVPMTFGLVATAGAGHLLDFLDEAAAAGGRVIAQTHCRGISVLLSLKTRLPFDLIEAWHHLRGLPVEEQLRILADPEQRGPLVEAAVEADYGRWTGVGAQARPPDFEGIKVYERGSAPQSLSGRRGPATPDASGRSHDRSVRRFAGEPALHTAQSVSPGRVHVAAGPAAPEGGDDLLGLGRPSQPDRRFVDPHPPSRVLGSPAPGIHPGRGGPHDHPGPRPGLGLHRPGPSAGRDGGRHQRVRSVDRGSRRSCARRRPTRREAGGWSSDRRAFWPPWSTVG